MFCCLRVIRLKLSLYFSGMFIWHGYGRKCSQLGMNVGMIISPSFQSAVVWFMFATVYFYRIDSRRVRRGIPHYQVHWLCSLMTITDTYLEQKEEDKEIEPWEFPTLERIDVSWSGSQNCMQCVQKSRHRPSILHITFVCEKKQCVRYCQVSMLQMQGKS